MSDSGPERIVRATVVQVVDERDKVGVQLRRGYAERLFRLAAQDAKGTKSGADTEVA